MPKFHIEKYRILAYSPLAFGVLMENYLGERLTLIIHALTISKLQTPYSGENGRCQATHKYYKLAHKDYDLTLTPNGPGLVNSRPFITS